MLVQQLSSIRAGISLVASVLSQDGYCDSRYHIPRRTWPEPNALSSQSSIFFIQEETPSQKAPSRFSITSHWLGLCQALFSLACLLLEAEKAKYSLSWPLNVSHNTVVPNEI